MRNAFACLVTMAMACFGHWLVAEDQNPLGRFGAEADGDSQEVSISADGRFVGFVSFATNLPLSGDLYGVEVDLSFEGRLRGEERFETVEALKEQIARDVARARSQLGL